MSRVYDILVEHNESGLGDNAKDVDSISTSPYAIIAVWRYKFPVTFSREKTASFTRNPLAATELRNDPLIIVDDLRNISVSCGKSNYIGQLQAGLHPGMNYFQEIFPGDHLACWMVNSQELAKELILKIERSEQCNNFLDGLKFVGRVSGLRKNINQNPGGIRTSSYNLTAASFTELDASIYFDPYLADAETRIGSSWLKTTGLKIDELLGSTGTGIGNQPGYVNADKILPVLFGAFYGLGIPRNYGTVTGPNVTAGLDDPNAMIIPQPVGKILGVRNGSKPNGAFAYTDIVEFIHGIQQYSSVGPDPQMTLQAKQTPGPRFLNHTAANIFTPDNINSSPNDRRRSTGYDLLASFLPQTAQFTGQRTVWSILQQYLNPAINEMYACLRPNAAGEIFPTIVIRQLPFNSGLISNTYTPKSPTVATEVPEPSDQKTGKKKNDEPKPKQELLTKDRPRQLTLTKFAEVPRWYAHPVLIRQLDVGRSDATRFNFVHITSDAGYSTGNQTNQLIRDPPVIDDLDMYRSGLRPYITSVSTSTQDIVNRKSGDWMYILSDILMGQHLTLNGQVQLLGVQAPICPGDNFEFDQHIFHIESVSHNFQIQMDGTKSFSTTLALSHGVRIDQLDGKDLSLYTGAAKDDLARYEAPVATDYTLSPTEPSNPESEGVTVVESTDEGGYA